MNSVLLIRAPNINAGYSFLASNPPLNLMYIAASLEKNNIAVQILDFEAESFNKNKLLESAKKAVIIGVTSFTNSILSAIELITIIKKQHPDKLFIMGGVHVSALPERSLIEFKEIDLIAVGEGEYSIVNLYNKYEQHKFSKKRFFMNPSEIPKGFMYLQDGIIHYHKSKRITDLDALPFPKRNMDYQYRGTLIRGAARDHFVHSTDIITSRGCPFNCYFCAVDIVFKKEANKRIIFRSIDNIKEEIKILKEKFKYTHVWIADSSFNASPARAIKISELLKKYNIKFNCNLNIKNTNQALLRALKINGCIQISAGIESGNPEIRKKLNKPISDEKIKWFFKECKKIKLRTDATFIFGSHPEESYYDILKTMKLVLDVKPDSIGILSGVPLPGTPMYKEFIQFGLLSPNEDWSSFVFLGKASPWGTNKISGKTISTLQRKALLKFYTQPYQIANRIRLLTSFKQLKIYFQALVTLVNKQIV